MWTDVQNSFNNWLVRKCSMYTPQRFSSYLHSTLYLVKFEDPKILLIFITASAANCWHVPADTLSTWFNMWLPFLRHSVCRRAVGQGCRVSKDQTRYTLLSEWKNRTQSLVVRRTLRRTVVRRHRRPFVAGLSLIDDVAQAMTSFLGEMINPSNPFCVMAAMATTQTSYFEHYSTANSGDVLERRRHCRSNVAGVNRRRACVKLQPDNDCCDVTLPAMPSDQSRPSLIIYQPCAQCRLGETLYRCLIKRMGR